MTFRAEALTGDIKVRLRAGEALIIVTGEFIYNVKLVVIGRPICVLGSLLSLNEANALEGS